MFSRLSLEFKNLLNIFFGNKNNCQRINLATSSSKDRVNQINIAAPECCCENSKMSKFSPFPIENSESIARFIFSPMFIDKKNGKIKPSIFSHVSSKGCSVQRETNAKDDEITNFISDFLSKDVKEAQSWHSVLIADCEKLRKILINSKRAICVYDTSTKNNPAHGEICLTKEIAPENIAELRHELFQAFSTHEYPNNYRNSVIQNKLNIK